MAIKGKKVVPFDLDKALSGSKVVHSEGWYTKNLARIGDRLVYQNAEHEDSSTVYQCGLNGLAIDSVFRGTAVLHLEAPAPIRTVCYSRIFDGGITSHGSHTEKEARTYGNPVVKIVLDHYADGTVVVIGTKELEAEAAKEV